MSDLLKQTSEIKLKKEEFDSYFIEIHNELLFPIYQSLVPLDIKKAIEYTWRYFLVKKKNENTELKAQLEKAESVLKNTIKSAEFFMSHADCKRDTWTCRCSFCKDTENSRYLNDARNYFKEKE